MYHTRKEKEQKGKQGKINHKSTISGDPKRLSRLENAPLINGPCNFKSVGPNEYTIYLYWNLIC